MGRRANAMFVNQCQLDRRISTRGSESRDDIFPSGEENVASTKCKAGEYA